MAYGQFFHGAGQSNENGFGTSSPTGIPAMPFYRRGMPSGSYSFSDPSPTVMAVTNASVVHHGPEIQFAKDYNAAGRSLSNAFYLKTGYGGTFITEWLQGAGGIEQHARVLRALRGARFPRSHVDYHFMWWQGEQEALNANGALAAAWAGNFATMIGQYEAALGKTLASISIVKPHASMSGAPNLSAIRGAVDSAALTTGATVINIDDLTLEVDGVHVNPAGSNAVGSRRYSAIYAA